MTKVTRLAPLGEKMLFSADGVEVKLTAAGVTKLARGLRLRKADRGNHRHTETVIGHARKAHQELVA